MDQYERKEPGFYDEYEQNADEGAPKARRHFYTRSTDKHKSYQLTAYWTNLLMFFLIGFSFLGIDFILYAASGAGNIYDTFPILRKEILLILGLIALILGVIYFCISGFSTMLCLLTAGIVYMFSTAMFNHFANFNSVAEATGHSEAYISLVLAAIAFILLAFSNKKVRFFFACASVFSFGAVLCHQNIDKPEFNVNETPMPASATNRADNRKIINIMMPNLPSYGYIASLSDDFANKVYREQLRSIMLGFYAQYGFKIFPNAYVSKHNPYINAADSMNMKVPNNQYDNLQLQVMKDSYWQFKNRNDFEAYLKNSRLIDKLTNEGFTVNAYQSHGVNLCRKDNKNNVARCVTRITNPAAMKSDLFENAGVLLAQWLENTGWFKHTAEFIYRRLERFYDPKTTPILGMSYNGLAALDTLKTLDLVAEDIDKDQGRQAYFVFLDMPSELFIYDEMCRLMPSDSWLPKNNKIWVARRIDVMEKREAYMHQSMCVYGKLSEFLQNLKNKGYLNNAVVILQGLNGMDDMFGDRDDSLVTSFLNGLMTDVAIYDSNSKKFSINKTICAIPDIIGNYFGGEKCTEFEGISSAKSTKQSIRRHLAKISYTNDIAKKSYLRYKEWMKAWNEINYKSFIGLPKKSTVKEDEIVIRHPQMQPLEEANIKQQKMMSGQVEVAPEAATQPLSEVAQKEPIDAPQSGTDELFPPTKSQTNEGEGAQ